MHNNQIVLLKGVCGKTADVANLQDLLLFLLKGISKNTVCLREAGKEYSEANRFIMESLFMTITNANFDKERFVDRIRKAITLRDKLTNEVKKLGFNEKDFATCDSMTWSGQTVEAMEEKAKQVGILKTENEDIRSLRELLTYGVKGIAAYAEHACNLGHEDNEIYAFMQSACRY